jgi:hypothetical protein
MLKPVMKFNRKVYVIPEEKYNSVQEILKSRMEGDHNGGHPQSGKLTERSEGAAGLQTLNKEEMESVGGPQTNSNEKSDAAVISSEASSDILKACEASLENEEQLVNNLRAIYYQLLPLPTLHGKNGNPANGRDEYEGLLLHTQSSAFPVPNQHRRFYSLLLERDVPHRLIANKRLRRVLHYLRNKLMKEEEEEEETEEEETEGEEERKSRDKWSKERTKRARYSIGDAAIARIERRSIEDNSEKKKKKRKNHNEKKPVITNGDGSAPGADSVRVRKKKKKADRGSRVVESAINGKKKKKDWISITGKKR